MEERFWSKVDRGAHDECWPWTAFVEPRGGYGRFRLDAQSVAYAHRVAWELTNGPIPEGLVIDHLCRNRSCQNPGHMEVVTQSENARRQVSPLLDRTHCPQGHEYTDANTYREPGRVHRQCRECHRMQQREYLARKADAA